MRDIEPGPGRTSKDLQRRAEQKVEGGGFLIDIPSCFSIMEMSGSEEWKDLASMVINRIKTII